MEIIKEAKIGDIVEVDGNTYKVIENMNDGCLDCVAVDNDNLCSSFHIFGMCSENNRQDDKDIIYIKK